MNVNLSQESATYPRAARRRAVRFYDVALVRGADVAKGLAYVIAAGLAGGLALTSITASASDGLVAGLVERPLTRGLLVVMALGLIVYALWKLVCAVRDPRDDPEGMLRRVAAAAVGGVHLLAAIVTVSACWAATHPQLTPLSAQLIAPRFGAWSIMLLGLGVTLTGALQIYRAISGGYESTLDPQIRSNPYTRRLLRFGQAGMIARGLALPLIGTFLVVTASDSDPYAAMSLSAGLEALLARGAGPFMLLFVALATAIYGGAVIALARYRRE